MQPQVRDEWRGVSVDETGSDWVTIEAMGRRDYVTALIGLAESMGAVPFSEREGIAR